MSDGNLSRSLTGPSDDRAGRNLPVPADAYWASANSLDVQAEDAAAPISQYLWVLKRHRWKIVSFTLASMLATLIISKRLTPVYESITTVDVDRQMPAGIIG